MFKKIIALIISVSMVLSLFVGCQKKDDSVNQTEITKSQATSTTANEPSSKKLFDKTVKLTYLIQSNAQTPYQQDWYVYKAIEEKTNVKLEIEAVGSGAFTEKINLIIASGTLPDLIGQASMAIPVQYGQEGAFINALDYVNKQPNFKKWYEKSKIYAQSFVSGDGKMYGYPNEGIGETNRLGWIYRKDIFEKEKLSIPKDDKELYTILKTLKSLYPKSYPLVMAGTLFLRFTAVAWGTEQGMYYDSVKKVWKYGPVEDNYKEMISFFNKLYIEGLIPPDFTTINLAGADTLIANDQAFIYPTYFHLFTTINANQKPSRPAFEMWGMPPFKGGANGVAKMPDWATYGGNITISKNSKNIDDALKFVDWMYTDEATELLSWGEEGKTYKIVDGKKKFILDGSEETALRKQYGLSTFGAYLRFNFDTFMSFKDEKSKQLVSEIKKYDIPRNPGWSIFFIGPEKEVNTTVGQDILNHTNSEILKFIMGKRSLDEWNVFVKEINDRGLSKLISAYETTYNKMQGSK